MSRAAHLSPLFRFASWRELLDLLAMLRDFRDPIDSPEGLRRAIDVLLKLGESLGVDPTLLARLRSIAQDPHVLEIALAVLRYVLSFVNQPSQSTIAAADSNVSVQSLNLADWLALLTQLIELFRRLQRQA